MTSPARGIFRYSIMLGRPENTILPYFRLNSTKVGNFMLLLPESPESGFKTHLPLIEVPWILEKTCLEDCG
jgi:hypothetical protein